MSPPLFARFLICAALLITTACTSSSPSPSSSLGAMPELFQVEPTPDRDTLQRTGNAYLNRLLANPVHEQVTLIKMTPALITGQTQDLAVTLPDGETAQFHLRDFTNITAGIDGWVGYKASDWKKKNAPASDTEIDNDPFYYLSVAREGDTLVGSLIVDGQSYRIDNIGAGQHVLIKMDESKLPKEAEPIQSPHAMGVVDNTIGNVPQSAQSYIRVMFLATNQRKAASPNFKLELANALNDANQYMINSRVNITYELAGYYEGAYDEAGRSYSQQLNDLGNAQPFAAQVLSKRAALRAHLVSMYTTANASCGMAYRPASKASAHSVITCLGSLGHEMGHNLGATHNWDSGDAEGNPPYMYGYRYTGTPRFRTQMSYDCVTGGTCPRVAYHSNPRLTYKGVVLGTAAHHDVARLFNERREEVEGFYPTVHGVLAIEDNAELGTISCAAPFGLTSISFFVCGYSNQFWKIEQHDNTNLSKIVAADGRCLTVGLLEVISLGLCRSQPNSLWRVVQYPGDKLEIRDAYDQCLGMTAVNAALKLSRCDNSSSQRWIRHAVL